MASESKLRRRGLQGLASLSTGTFGIKWQWKVASRGENEYDKKDDFRRKGRVEVNKHDKRQSLIAPLSAAGSLLPIHWQRGEADASKRSNMHLQLCDVQTANAYSRR